MPEANRHTPSNFPLTSSTSPIILGTLHDIYRRSTLGCPFCGLVVQSVHDGTPTADIVKALAKVNATCFLNWQLDGRKIKPSSADKNRSVRGFTRRIHIGWKNKALKDAYLVFVARERYTLTPSDAQKVWGKEQLFMGRRVEVDGSIQARIKSWLDLCKGQHRGPCNHEDFHALSRFDDMVSHSYFGVVDVHNMQLVALPSARLAKKRYSRYLPYAALSYVWGDTSTYRTRLENIPLLRTHGGIEKVLNQLPTVIKDAIDLTRRLGLQYIWIDALCIVQDSPQSWKLNAYNMDIIYGSADLTICAADGQDASAGLRAMRMNDHNGHQQMADCAPGVRLVVSRPPEMYIKASKWNTRAWTFQERLLSTRCLIFTAGRVYFQCRSTGMSEDIYADREGAGWSLDFVDAPMQMFRQLPQRAFWVYTKIVTLYTHRELSKSEDILAASSGIRNLMKDVMNAPFVFGLPSSHFDLAILWQHIMPVQRRNVAQTQSERHEKPVDFPSWCWSGWQGAATAYSNDMVGDCLDNVNEWLDKHTWIKWHIRDGRGDLRPLWDAEHWQVDQSEDERWKGYRAERSAWPVSMRPRLAEKRVAFDEGPWNANETANRRSTAGRYNYTLRGPTHDARIRDDFSTLDIEDEQRRWALARQLEHLEGERERLWEESERAQIRERTRDSVRRRNDNRRRPSSEHASDTDSELELRTSSRRRRLPPRPPRPPLHNEQALSGALVRVSRPRSVDDSDQGSNSASSDEDNVTQRPVNRNESPHLPSPPITVTDSEDYPAQIRARPTIRNRSSRQNVSETATRYVDEYGFVHTAPQTRTRERMRRFESEPKNSHRQSFESTGSTYGYHAVPDASSMPTISEHHSKAYPASPYSAYTSALPPTSLPPTPLPPTPSSGLGHTSEFFDQYFDHGAHANPAAIQANPTFNITLREYPYHVVMAPFDPDPESKGYPLMPILQFWTYHTFLYVRSTPSNLTNGLVRCHIGDSIGDWCGSIILDESWVASMKSARQEFIAISEAKKFTKEECEAWTYYIPKEREQSESEWDLYYVLLVERKDEKWQRIGLGKVFKECFRKSTWKEIMLG
jgi:hypothetical protein